VAEEVDVDRWAARALTMKVGFAVGREFAFDGLPRPYARLAFSRSNEAELQEGVRRMVSALPLRRPRS
jgi:DNA-binding transcriptional MocR family regulator